MARKALLIFLLIFAAPLSAAPQDEVTVQAALSSESITEEDVVQLVVSIAAPGNIGEVDVQLPLLRDFDKIGEQSSSQLSQFNLEIRTVLRYTYNLRPKRQGTFTIPPFTVRVGGKSYTTEPLRVTVTPGGSGDEIILRQRTDKNEAFVGEQLLLTTELLFQVNVLSYDIIEEPAPEGFVVERDESLKQVVLEEIEFRGQPYYRAVLGRQILFPLSPGSKRIRPPQFQIEYRGRGFGLQSKLARRTANTLEIEVKPLPEAGKPAGYNGAVGDYRLSWSISDTAGRVNEPLTLSVELTGNGDIARTPDLSPPLPAEFELINSRSEQSARLRDGAWGGRKRWEFIFIPNRAGDITLGPLEYPFFDPATGQYKLAAGEPIQLLIEPPAPASRAESAAALPAEAESSEWDIRYIKTPSAPLALEGSPFFHSPFFWAAMLIPVLANILIFAGTRLLRRGRGRGGDLRRRKALNIAVKRLARAPGGKSASSEISAALIDYFADKLNLERGGLSMVEVRNTLVRRDLHQHPLVDEISAVFEACDAARYAPGGESRAAWSDLAERAAKALSQLDELI